MSSVLLSTKLRSPGRRPGIMARPRLAEAVAASGTPVVLVVAPPGFGKTMLLTQWEELDDRPFAWVSLDRRDNDPIVLWRYLVESVRSIEPGFADAFESAARSGGPSVLETFIPRVLNELEAIGREIVLVLDDYHYVTSQECHDSIAFLLKRGPTNTQLVVSSRSDPPLPVGRLRANGGLFEFRAADLSFTRAETAELFAGAFDLDLTPASIATLQSRTEGWPAGLYLAFLSVRGASDPSAALAAFGGSSRHVVEYLSEVVLASETDEHRSFLLETSILDRMSASLCDSVTGGGDSEGMLAEIEHANLFLVPLNDRREWFRYHHLFADLLRDELRRRDPGLLCELHRRACEWFMSAGYIDDAIDHAIKGGDNDTAANLIGTHWLEYMNSGRISTLTGWLEDLPADFRRTHAGMCIVEAWTLAAHGFAEEARRALDAAREAGSQGQLPDGSGTVEEAIALVEASFLWSDVGRMFAAARRVYDSTSLRSAVWQPVIAFSLGWALVLTGEPAEAVAPLKDAFAAASRTQQWVIAGDACCVLSKTHLAAGDFEQAQRWIDEAFETARSHGFADLPHIGIYHVALGTLHARRGELDLADHELGLGLEQMRGREPVLIGEALLERALLAGALGDRGAARAMLAEARAAIESCPDPGILSQRLEEVSRKLTSARPRADPDDVLTERELDVLQLLAEGMTKREVGTNLFVAYSTVHSHTKSIYRKLNGTSRDDVVERARALGLIPPS